MMNPDQILELVAHYGYLKQRYTIDEMRSGEPEDAGYRMARYAFQDVKDALEGKNIPLPRENF